LTRPDARSTIGGPRLPAKEHTLRRHPHTLRTALTLVLLSAPIVVLAAFGLLGRAQSASASAAYEYSQAHLIVVKHVVNNDGGTAKASDFTMTIGGVPAQGGNSFPGSEAGTDKVVTVVATGSSYSVTETGPGGYQATFSSGCSGTIAAGQTKTCTVTNDDNALPKFVLMCVHVGRKAVTVVVPRPLVPLFLALGATLGPC
jgi:hypothetical protein